MKRQLFLFILALSVFSIFSGSSKAFAQYGGGGSSVTSATPEQQQECNDLGISQSECTENAILAKRRILAVQGNVQSDSMVRLTGQSSGGKYTAEIGWYPASVGSDNTFYVSIFDSNNIQLPSASYGFAINGDTQTTKISEHVSESTRLFTYRFDQQGAYDIRLSNINGSGDSVEIPIRVTPEFPLSAIGAMAAVIGVVTLVGRIWVLKRPSYQF